MRAKRCSYSHPHNPDAFDNHSGTCSFGNHSGTCSFGNHSGTCSVGNHSGTRSFALNSPGCTDYSGDAFHSSVSGSGRSQPAV